MKFEEVNEKNQKIFNNFATHPLQSYEWGKFREKTGLKIIRKIGYEKGEPTCSLQITIHKIPKTPWNIGYYPKGVMPTKEILEELKNIGKKEKCIFIQLEPDIETSQGIKLKIENLGLQPSFHPLFTKFDFILDITKSEDELLKNMSSKTRYNIKVAQKHQVKIAEDNSSEAFSEYLKLTKETTIRQHFYAHSEKYHQLMWETLKDQRPDELTAHLLLAKYRSIILVAWIIFVFKDTLYYPYGASSNKNRETMASNLMMWEAIKFGKQLGLHKFDLWGALDFDPDKNDAWYGFHRFKQGYSPRHVEFVGSYDLVLKTNLYHLYKIADKLRWLFLKLKTFTR